MATHSRATRSVYSKSVLNNSLRIIRRDLITIRDSGLFPVTGASFLNQVNPTFAAVSDCYLNNFATLTQTLRPGTSADAQDAALSWQD